MDGAELGEVRVHDVALEVESKRFLEPLLVVLNTYMGRDDMSDPSGQMVVGLCAEDEGKGAKRPDLEHVS